jgi:hypothetical protein
MSITTSHLIDLSIEGRSIAGRRRGSFNASFQATGDASGSDNILVFNLGIAQARSVFLLVRSVFARHDETTHVEAFIQASLDFPDETPRWVFGENLPTDSVGTKNTTLRVTTNISWIDTQSVAGTILTIRTPNVDGRVLYGGMSGDWWDLPILRRDGYGVHPPGV